MTDLKATTAAVPPTRFRVQRKTVRPMLHAITGTLPNQFQPGGALGLQDVPGLNGVFATRIGRTRRALSTADDAIIAGRKALTAEHVERFPEGHDQAGQPTPVFERDQMGRLTDRVIPGSFNPAPTFDAAFKAFLDEYVVIECQGFFEDDFAKFGDSGPSLGKIVDTLIDLFRGGATDIGADTGETAPAISLHSDEKSKSKRRK